MTICNTGLWKSRKCSGFCGSTCGLTSSLVGIKSTSFQYEIHDLCGPFWIEFGSILAQARTRRSAHGDGRRSCWLRRGRGRTRSRCVVMLFLYCFMLLLFCFMLFFELKTMILQQKAAKLMMQRSGSKQWVTIDKRWLFLLKKDEFCTQERQIMCKTGGISALIEWWRRY